MVCPEKNVQCVECSAGKVRFSSEQVKAALSKPSDDTDDEEENSSNSDVEEGSSEGVLVSDESEDDDGEDDTSEEEDEDAESEDEASDTIMEGDFVWAPLGSKKLPAQVIALAAVPVYLHRQLMTRQSEHLCVKWVGETDRRGKEVDRFSIFPRQTLLVLGEDAADQLLANKCPLKYLQALNLAQCS